MFKIRINDLSHYRHMSEPYQILYEAIPDITKGVENRIMHESCFKSLRKANKVGSDLSHFLSESLTFLELIYTKLKQYEMTVSDKPEYLEINFLDIEKSRIVVMRGKEKTLFAYEHIINLLQFQSHLKYWCFHIAKEYGKGANDLFALLDSFETHFINSYRSAKILSEKNSLKLFL